MPTLPEHLVAKYKTTDAEEIRKQKCEAESFSKSIADVVETKSYSADEIKKLAKDAGVEYLDGYENRVVTFTISTEDVDRDSDVVRQAGIDKSDYMKNPVIMFAHNSRALPIGATLKIWRSNNATKALALIYDKRVDDTGLSETIFKMVKAGALRGASIGFSTKEARYPTDEEMKELGMNQWGVIFEKTSLHEWSVVSIPANQNSLRGSKSFEEKDFDVMKEFGLIEEKVEKTDKTDENNKVLEKLDSLEKSINSLKTELSEIKKSISDIIPKGLTSENDEKEYDDMLDKIQGLVKSFQK